MMYTNLSTRPEFYHLFITLYVNMRLSFTFFYKDPIHVL